MLILAGYQDWLKTLPPNIQTLLYAIEAGVVTALIVFLSSLYAAFNTPQGLSGFNWHTQLNTLGLAVGAAVIKALIDLLKGAPPSQQKG